MSVVHLWIPRQGTLPRRPDLAKIEVVGDTCDADLYVSGFKGAMNLIINFASCPLWCHV